MRGCVGKQRRRKLGDLRAERALPLAQPLDQLRVQHLLATRRARRPLREAFCTSCARASASARAARARASSALMSPSCCVERLPASAPPWSDARRARCFCAIVGDRLLRLGHAPAQALDLLLQPGGRRDRRFALRVLLQLDEGVRHRVRHFGGELRVGRGELDADDARLLQRIDREPLEIAVHHALADGRIGRVLAEAEHDQERAHAARAAAPDRIPAGASGRACR